ncbi:MAG: type IX secretion system membrane protein PorP/SprF [Bacteroidetes bacterium]|nr:MAG: type IX secretion system membrane protein PorP/SprF [Bacteroidota bacterium]TAG89283.1 MAG: type IX secretion system membrane protein PorP/SprF [Bacteroidota bacterium]
MKINFILKNKLLFFRQQFLQKKKFVAFLLYICVICSFTQAQNVQFTQFNLNPLQTNPAMIAGFNQSHVTLNYRKQFIGFGESFVTPMFSGFMPYFRNNKRWGAFGLSLIQDQVGNAGVLKTTGGNFTFAKNFELKPDSENDYKPYLSLGIQAGYYQKQLNFSALTSGSQWQNGSFPSFVPSLPLNENLGADTKGFFNANFGLQYYTADSCGRQKFFAGIAVQNLTRPNVSFFSEKSNLPLIFIGTAGYDWAVSGNISVMPNFRWIQDQTTKQGRFGVMGYYHLNDQPGFLEESKVGVGAYYDINGAVAMGLEVHQKNFFVGFSYDMAASKNLNSLGNGAIEFTIGAKFGKKCRIKPVEEIKDEFIYDTTVVEKQYKELGVDSVFTNVAKVNVRTKEVAEVVTINKKVVQRDDAALLIPTEEDLKIFKNPAYFYYVSSDINRSTKVRLEQIAEMMTKFKGVKIEIQGHACNIGVSEEANLKLSNDRSIAIKNSLVAQGIKEDRIKISGFGSKQPILANTTEYGRTKNRRVEFKILSIGNNK